MKKYQKVLAILMIVFVLSVSLVACNTKSEEKEETNEYKVTQEEYDLINKYKSELNNIQKYDLLLKTMDYVKGNYYKDFDDEMYSKADQAMAKAFVSSLDKYSSLRLASEILSKSTAGIGLGLEVTMYNEYRISYVHPNTPAGTQKSTGGKYSLMRGDLIYAVNGQRVEGANYYLFQALSVGGEGTPISLTIKRPVLVDGVIQYKFLDENFNLVKQATEVNGQSVLKEAYYVSTLSKDVGYIKLLSFTGNADKDFVNAIKEFKADNKKQLILDLRGNGGGSSDILSVIASYLIIDKEHSNQIPIIQLENKQGQKTNVLTKENNYINVPICVLVNQGTASASEALTSAMMYYKTGTIIGTKTYGKGTALNLPSPLVDKTAKSVENAYITIVVMKYNIFIDGGFKNIEGIGLTPDTVIKENPFTLKLKDDNYIKACFQKFGINENNNSGNNDHIVTDTDDDVLSNAA